MLVRLVDVKVEEVIAQVQIFETNLRAISSTHVLPEMLKLFNSLYDYLLCFLLLLWVNLSIFLFPRLIIRLEQIVLQFQLLSSLDVFQRVFPLRVMSYFWFSCCLLMLRGGEGWVVVFCTCSSCFIMIFDKDTPIEIYEEIFFSLKNLNYFHAKPWYLWILSFQILKHHS
jgi:hypothetical protein